MIYAQIFVITWDVNVLQKQKFKMCMGHEEQVMVDLSRAGIIIGISPLSKLFS